MDDSCGKDSSEVAGGSSPNTTPQSSSGGTPALQTHPSCCLPRMPLLSRRHREVRATPVIGPLTSGSRTSLRKGDKNSRGCTADQSAGHVCTHTQRRHKSCTHPALMGAAEVSSTKAASWHKRGTRGGMSSCYSTPSQADTAGSGMRAARSCHRWGLVVQLRDLAYCDAPFGTGLATHLPTQRSCA